MRCWTLSVLLAITPWLTIDAKKHSIGEYELFPETPSQPLTQRPKRTEPILRRETEQYADETADHASNGLAHADNDSYTSNDPVLATNGPLHGANGPLHATHSPAPTSTNAYDHAPTARAGATSERPERDTGATRAPPAPTEDEAEDEHAPTGRRRRVGVSEATTRTHDSEMNDDALQTTNQLVTTSDYDRQEITTERSARKANQVSSEEARSASATTPKRIRLTYLVPNRPLPPYHVENIKLLKGNYNAENDNDENKRLQGSTTPVPRYDSSEQSDPTEQQRLSGSSEQQEKTRAPYAPPRPPPAADFYSDDQ